MKYQLLRKCLEGRSTCLCSYPYCLSSAFYNCYLKSSRKFQAHTTIYTHTCNSLFKFLHKWDITSATFFFFYLTNCIYPSKMTYIEILFLNVWKNFTILKCIINNFISNYGFQGDCWFDFLCVLSIIL